MRTFEAMIGLTGSKALEARVKNVIRNTSATSRQEVESYKQEFRNLQSKLFEHTDLGQRDSNSLTVDMKDPSSWAKELYNIVIKMSVVANKIQICVNVHNKMFPTNMVEGLDSEDLEMIKDISGKEEVTDKETEE